MNFFLYYSLTKISKNPAAASNTANDSRGKVADGIAQAINNFFKSEKDLIIYSMRFISGVYSGMNMISILGKVFKAPDVMISGNRFYTACPIF